MQITGMLHGSRLLQFAGFPAEEVFGSNENAEQIKALLDRYGSVFVKPVFKGGVGKKSKAGLIGRAISRVRCAKRNAFTSLSTGTAISV